MKPSTTIVYAALLVLCASPARAAEPTLEAALRTLESGVYASAPDAMIEGRARIERIAEKHPRSALHHYWVAYADWRLVPRLLAKKAQAKRFLEDGLKRIDRALALDPRLAEAVALRSSLLGLGVQLEPATMMSVGLEIEATMQRARTMAPENPRVLLLDAMGTLHKPAFVGGGAEPALAKFVKAQERFEAERVARGANASALAPAWGRFEAWVWAGRSAAQLGDTTAARGYYDRALEIDPKNGWVRSVLIPELSRPDSAAAGSKSGS